MPYINIKVTDEEVSLAQKSALIAAATKMMVDILDKDPANTFVVIDEVKLENWGVGGLSTPEYRNQLLLEKE